MDLRVDDAALKTLVSKAVVDSLTPEAREKLIADAVAHVLTKPPEGGGYGYSKRSPLQSAFDGAVVDAARRYADEMLAKDEQFQAQLRTLFADVATSLFEVGSREAIVQSLANVIRHGLSRN